MTKQAKPIIHGRDHAPGGADPIPGLSSGGGTALPTLLLWSTQALGDGTEVVPSAGALNISYDHEAHSEVFWDSVYGGPTFTSPPWDAIVVGPGWYRINAWTTFVDYGNNVWLGVQIEMALIGFSPGDEPVPQFAALTRQVDGTNTDSTNPAARYYAGQFMHELTLYVEPGNKAQIFVSVFHKEAHTITEDKEWSLSITKLA